MKGARAGQQPLLPDSQLLATLLPNSKLPPGLRGSEQEWGRGAGLGAEGAALGTP